MPRPNRYHPYTRNGTSPPMMSSRLVHPPHTLQYPTQAPSSTSSPSSAIQPIPTLAQPQPRSHNLAQAHVLPTISERAPIPNFKHVPTTYIRAQTSDGKDLVPRSILQGPDGTFHVQMQVVRFPSEVKSPAGRLPPPPPLMLDPRLDAVRAASANSGAWYDTNGGQRPPTPYMGPGMGMGFPTSTNMNMNMRTSMGMNLDVQLPRKSSGASDSGYSEGRSEKMDDECAVFSEDDEEDAEGEEEGDYERDLKELVEQQRIMIRVVKERGYGMVNAGLPA